VGNGFIAKKFDICEILSKNFDIYIKIIIRDAGIFFRHQAELVLRHQMRVSNYFVKFFYSVPSKLPSKIFERTYSFGHYNFLILAYLLPLPPFDPLGAGLALLN
jgi:hypothetical protein